MLKAGHLELQDNWPRVVTDRMVVPKPARGFGTDELLAWSISMTRAATVQEFPRQTLTLLPRLLGAYKGLSRYVMSECRVLFDTHGTRVDRCEAAILPGPEPVGMRHLLDIMAYLRRWMRIREGRRSALDTFPELKPGATALGFKKWAERVHSWAADDWVCTRDASGTLTNLPLGLCRREHAGLQAMVITSCVDAAAALAQRRTEYTARRVVLMLHCLEVRVLGVIEAGSPGPGRPEWQLSAKTQLEARVRPVNYAGWVTPDAGMCIPPLANEPLTMEAFQLWRGQAAEMLVPLGAVASTAIVAAMRHHERLQWAALKYHHELRQELEELGRDLVHERVTALLGVLQEAFDAREQPPPGAWE